MDKLVIALACSPSKGFNSDTMLDKFIEGMRQVKGVTVEKIYLNDLKIDNYTFFNKIPKPENDQDLIALVEKIQKSQGLVISVPTFNFGVPAQLKNFIDRIGYVSLDYAKLNFLKQPTGKLNYLSTFFISSCGASLFMQKLLFMVFPIFWLRVVMIYYGAKVKGGLYGCSLNAQRQAKDNPKLLTKCLAKGRHFASNL